MFLYSNILRLYMSKHETQTENNQTQGNILNAVLEEQGNILNAVLEEIEESIQIMNNGGKITW